MVEPSLPASELEKILNRGRISGAPVLEEGRLVGVVSRADLDRAGAADENQAESLLAYYEDIAGSSPGRTERAQLLGERAEHLRGRDVMQTELVTVPPMRRSRSSPPLSSNVASTGCW